MFVFFFGDRKRKAWAKRRRRQSGTKSSLKTLPKEDDSDDACKNILCLQFVCLFFLSLSHFVSGIKQDLIFCLHLGLISSSGSSNGEDSDPESSNSGDSAFSEDINKMVKKIITVLHIYQVTISNECIYREILRFHSLLPLSVPGCSELLQKITNPVLYLFIAYRAQV